jgi:hyperosmotically inducible periplasmic protein
MNRNRVVCLAMGTLIALVACGAQAQSSSDALSASASASVPAASSMSAKETKAANRKLQRAVLRALATTKGLSAANITVRANNGAITLEGGVPDQSQVDLAARSAASVAGVTSVKNALRLTTF